MVKKMKYEFPQNSEVSSCKGHLNFFSTKNHFLSKMLLKMLLKWLLDIFFSQTCV